MILFIIIIFLTRQSAFPWMKEKKVTCFQPWLYLLGQFQQKKTDKLKLFTQLELFCFPRVILQARSWKRQQKLFQERSLEGCLFFSLCFLASIQLPSILMKELKGIGPPFKVREETFNIINCYLPQGFLFCRVVPCITLFYEILLTLLWNPSLYIPLLWIPPLWDPPPLLINGIPQFLSTTKWVLDSSSFCFTQKPLHLLWAFRARDCQMTMIEAQMASEGHLFMVQFLLPNHAYNLNQEVLKKPLSCKIYFYTRLDKHFDKLVACFWGTEIRFPKAFPLAFKSFWPSQMSGQFWNSYPNNSRR